MIGLVDRRQFGFHHVQIRPAHAAHVHFHSHVAGSGFRHGHLPELQGSRANIGIMIKNHRFHKGHCLKNIPLKGFRSSNFY